MQDFRNFWFETGTPTFLIKLLKSKGYDVRELESLRVSELTFSSYEIADLRPVPLLWQTGYLTIKDYDPRSRLYRLSYPNYEVQNAFMHHLLDAFSSASDGLIGGYLWDLLDALQVQAWEEFFASLGVFFAGIPYDIQIPQERYYQTVFYLIFKLMGLQIGAEVRTNRGRIDAVIELDEGIFIFEFKLDGTAEAALAQIAARGYDEQYRRAAEAHLPHWRGLRHRDAQHHRMASRHPDVSVSMETRVLPVDPQQPEPEVIAQAAQLIRAGEVVAFPTETVYGLGADAWRAEAVQRIFAAKERPAYDPLIVHLADATWLPQAVKHAPPVARELAARFWPGPLTLVLPRGERIPDIVTAGGETVAVRVPAHPVALALLHAAEAPIAAPSANRFGHVSPTRAEHVLADLDGRIPLILDGGPTPVGVESTVLSLATPYADDPAPRRREPRVAARRVGRGGAVYAICHIPRRNLPPCGGDRGG